jgi:hypothetical protein
MHREVEHAGGTYALRESSEVHGREFAPENEVLRNPGYPPDGGWRRRLDLRLHSQVGAGNPGRRNDTVGHEAYKRIAVQSVAGICPSPIPMGEGKVKA